jgi:hypothetical protein
LEALSISQISKKANILIASPQRSHQWSGDESATRQEIDIFTEDFTKKIIELPPHSVFLESNFQRHVRFLIAEGGLVSFVDGAADHPHVTNNSISMQRP